MPHYLGQFTYHRKTWAALAKQPEDRADVVSRAMEGVDARLLSFYYCHGKYDGLMIFEAPDDVVAEAVAIAGVGAGHLKDLGVIRLLSMEEARSAMQMAGRGRLPVPTVVDSALRSVAIHHRDESQQAAQRIAACWTAATAEADPVPHQGARGLASFVVGIAEVTGGAW